MSGNWATQYQAENELFLSRVEEIRLKLNSLVCSVKPSNDSSGERSSNDSSSSSLRCLSSLDDSSPSSSQSPTGKALNWGGGNPLQLHSVTSSSTNKQVTSSAFSPSASTFVPSFQALANAASAAAVSSNPHQFGQIFGLNNFTHLVHPSALSNFLQASAQPPPPPPPPPTFAQSCSSPSSSSPSPFAHTFSPFHFLSSMNQAAVAAAAAAAAVNSGNANGANGASVLGGGTVNPNHNSPSSSNSKSSASQSATAAASNVAAHTFAMLAASQSAALEYRFSDGRSGTGHPLSTPDLGRHYNPFSSPNAASSAAIASPSSFQVSSSSSPFKDDTNLEMKAKSHREAASRVSECESVYSIARFENKPPHDAQYSTKVFVGGVPWDMNNDDMMEVFGPFGALAIQRPGKDVRLSRASQGLDKAGYLYIIFDSDTSVHRLLKYCKLEMTEGGHRYFYMLFSKRSKKEKRVQVIPWNTADSVCQVNPLAKEDQERTVFLGALHGMMNGKAVAEALKLIFGPVEFVALDTDKYKYPMGSGRAMFTHTKDYLKAVNAGFVRVKSDRFEKTVCLHLSF